MPEYSSDDAQYASHVVQRLFNREAQGLDMPPDVAMSDVESDTTTFSDQLELVQAFNLKMPSVQIDDEMVPASLAMVLGGSAHFPFYGRRGFRAWRRDPFLRDFLYYNLRPRLRKDKFNDVTLVDPETARVTFMRRATNFVATRIAAVRGFRNNQSREEWHRPSFLNLKQLSGGPQVVTPGCHFTISTNSNGLRVFWSGAYFITPNNFNHPTTPTSSVLQSGTYVFGVDGGAYGNQISWDFNLVVSLPGMPFAHLNF